ncbi:hypothetical protein [Streptomyces sp. YIM 98790]|uniref:SCO2584 family spore wall biosynthesis protein n=1 Tax=Streptomyces sp. YIM 98790 TaxID=2689077 RepID=UPI001409370B|nr:hypothetical protein [Streptomyces sp. YIM 98790]
MPEEVGGQPFPDGERPDDHDHDHDHGAADDAFAAVVFDEAFVAAAAVREPSAAERIARAVLDRAAEEAAAAEGAAEAEERAGQPGFFLDPPPGPGDAADPTVFRPLDGTGQGRGDGDPDGLLDSGPGSWFPDADLDGLGLRDTAPGIAGPYDRPDYARYLPDLPDDPGALAGVVSDAMAGGGHGERGVPGGRRPAGSPPPGRRPARWQRPVACVLAVMMGLSMIAIALIAVQRAGAWQRGVPTPVPPPSSEPGGSGSTTGTAEEAAASGNRPRDATGSSGGTDGADGTDGTAGGDGGQRDGTHEAEARSPAGADGVAPGSTGQEGTEHEGDAAGQQSGSPGGMADAAGTEAAAENGTEIVANGLGPFPTP